MSGQLDPAEIRIGLHASSPWLVQRAHHRHFEIAIIMSGSGEEGGIRMLTLSFSAADGVSAGLNTLSDIHRSYDSL